MPCYAIPNAGQGAATNFYSYNAFITAAAAFPAFATSPDTAANKRELAAFLAQISHETTGGWATAPGGPYAWGLCFITEGETSFLESLQESLMSPELWSPQVTA